MRSREIVLSEENLRSRIDRNWMPDTSDRFSIMVDIFWPHPMAAENPVTEHKCHKTEMMEFPSILFVSDNEKLHKYFSEKFKDPYDSEQSMVAKISCIYNDWLRPEKIIVILNKPLRLDPIDAEILNTDEIKETES